MKKAITYNLTEVKGLAETLVPVTIEQTENEYIMSFGYPGSYDRPSDIIFTDIADLRIFITELEEVYEDWLKNIR